MSDLILTTEEHAMIIEHYIPALIAANWTSTPGKAPTGHALYEYALSLYYPIKQALDPKYTKPPYIQVDFNGTRVDIKRDSTGVFTRT